MDNKNGTYGYHVSVKVYFYRMIRRFLKLTLIIILIVAAYNIKLIIYGIKQLNGQLHLVFNAEQLADVIGDNATPYTVKSKLLFINAVRKFGIEQLGLTNTKNYTTYFNQNNKPAMWVVTASQPYKLDEYLWHFPFLGAVPYKGFFNKEDAVKERNKIAALGYDADIGTVGGWSTLGFFTDPVLSNMLNRSEGQLAELILHEMVHATVYFADSTQFNENLATFIGEKGAEIFLQQYDNGDSLLLKSYLEFLSDEKIYGQYMLQSMQRLDSLYYTFNNKMSVYDKSLAKYRLMAEIMLGVKNLTLNNYTRYAWKFKDKKLPDNTHFLQFKRYRSTQQTFENVYQKSAGGNLKKFINLYKN